MKVYVDGYAADGTDVLVGYKGPIEADAAAFPRPYIPQCPPRALCWIPYF